MQTRISQFCEGAIEVGWLLAVMVAPLFFNVYSSRVFEPDKIALVRTIATLMVAAALIHWGEGALRKEGAPGREETQEAGGLAQALQIPLVVPALLLALVYVLSTITSIVPRTSLWGSYQRLQGTYSTLSYLAIFFLMLIHLRRTAQLQRLLMTLVVSSVPISLYGLLQHYGLDPLPWGGDVTQRVAANMGNPIFVAAYIILIIPVTLGQILHTLDEALDGVERTWRVGGRALFALVLLLIAWTWATMGFGRGLLMGLLGVSLFVLLAVYLRRPVARFLLLGAYGVALAAQLVVLIFSQSRGPLLGIIAGLFFLSLLIAFVQRWRPALGVIIASSVALLAFLVVVNLPNSPLPGFRNIRFIGNLGRVFEVEGGTGRVRVLIWQGNVEMLRANPLRTLIGYGPESMYVAYNPYYPPELAQYEARNASPDRSHNETFDALVTTGVMGLALYLVLFSLILYHGLHWLGVIGDGWEQRLFFLCGGAGIILGIVIPLILDKGSWRFTGVGIPIGLIAGLSIYLMVASLRLIVGGEDEAQERSSAEMYRLILLVALVSAIVAHLIEINFGIAIASTRTLFWVYAALLVLLGGRVVSTDAGERIEERVAMGADEPRSRARHSARGRRISPRPSRTAATDRILAEGEVTQLVMLGGVLGMLMATLVWNYTTNPLTVANPVEILVTSLTTMASAQAAERVSLGVFWIVMATWLVGTLVGVAQVAAGREEERGSETGAPITPASPGAWVSDPRWWVVAGGVVGGVAAGIGGLFALIHASRLAPSADVPNLIYGYYVALGLGWAALAGWITLRGPKPATMTRNGMLALLYPVLLVVCLLVIDGVNIRIIKADVIYKQGLRYDRAASWDHAIHFYQQAVETAPMEDYYHLFYGRAFMEKAKTQGGTGEQEQALRDAHFEEALRALSQAREMNPLNTDHTANLARIYRTWAEYDSDPITRREKIEQALALYDQATDLSPNNAQLWNEWGLVHLMLDDTDQALALYRYSLALDPQYAQTYLMMGDVYLRNNDWAKTIELFEAALEIDPSLVQAWSTVGYAYSQLGEMEKAIEANERVLEQAPNDYGTIKNMAILHSHVGRYEEALAFGRRALAVAPEDERESLQGFLAQIESNLEKD
jgi:tetratricopeptide (TPR) repeat protein/O-antigen ligase